MALCNGVTTTVGKGKATNAIYLDSCKAFDMVPPTSFSTETPPGILHPVLGSSAQEGQGPIGVSPEEGHKVDQGG